MTATAAARNATASTWRCARTSQSSASGTNKSIAGRVRTATPTSAPAKSASGRVSLLVNRGESGIGYVMPDLIGVNGDRAAEILRNRGFRVAVVGSTPYPGVAAGIVIRQSPQGGFQIAPGEPISLEVSR